MKKKDLILSKVGYWLRRRRAQSRMSSNDVVQVVTSLSIERLEQYERGQRPISSQMFMTLAQLYNSDREDLLDFLKKLETLGRAGS